MVRIDKNKGRQAAPLLAAGLLAALCAAAPARAQTAPQSETAFGQEMPKQYFINRLVNPSRETVQQEAREEIENKPTASRAPGRAPAAVEPAKAPPAGELAKAQPAGEAAGQQAANDGNYYDPYPRQFLVNRLFNSGGQ